MTAHVFGLGSSLSHRGGPALRDAPAKESVRGR